MSWIAAALLTLAVPVAPAGSAATAGPVPGARLGTPWLAESANFVVRNDHPAHDARQVAAHCEAWRAKLRQYWCPREQGDWRPRCEVVVHAGSRSYLAAAGAGAGATFGSSLLQFGDDRRVARRLIDFRGDSPHGLAAMPHELTHVILADLLGGRQPPRWADEGMAILADSRDKQLLHDRDLAAGLANRRSFRVAELLTLDGYPAAQRVPAFYGQSASLTAFLARRDDPEKFVEFLRRALDEGYDRALRDVYHLAHIGQLEAQWHAERSAWRGGYHGVRLTLDDAARDEAVSAEAARDDASPTAASGAE